ncbi:DMT family transporter [Rhodobacteraceae bacterium DSL-40]|uniref:EamA family transporter n=1 Tax=Amaricoccus sp. B4 TaxID=3368557 RepID=UPI000DAC7B09
MSSAVFAAVILAAFLHAAWNFLVKRGGDSGLAMIAVVTGHLPFALGALLVFQAPAPESWPFIAASAALHVGYQLFLLNSYRVGDLTQVYPIARGAAPLIVAAVSVSFLGVSLGRGELIGIAIIACGILSLGLVRQADGVRNHRAAVLALGTGCFIAAYSLVDGTGARLAGTGVGFFAWASILNGVAVLAGAALWRPGLLARLPREGLRPMLLGGGASFAAYAIVVWAFTEAPIALVTALRETSIVFALLLGVFALRERLDLGKVVSTMMTLAGAIVLRAARH